MITEENNSYVPKYVQIQNYILQKIQERSSWIGSGSTENSEGNDTYEDSEGIDSEDSSEDYSGDEDLTDSYDEM